MWAKNSFILWQICDDQKHTLNDFDICFAAKNIRKYVGSDALWSTNEQNECGGIGLNVFYYCYTVLSSVSSCLTFSTAAHRMKPIVSYVSRLWCIYFQWYEFCMLARYNSKPSHTNASYTQTKTNRERKRKRDSERIFSYAVVHCWVRLNGCKCLSAKRAEHIVCASIYNSFIFSFLMSPNLNARFCN